MPEHLAYLIFILRASQDFGEGVAWVTYNAASRCHAFITRNKSTPPCTQSVYLVVDPL